jgi:hypothetical protein
MWTTRRALIIGKTTPQYSVNHRELTCTGALVEPTMELSRLQPIPFRYMDGEHQFHDWQWVTVDVREHPSDTRPHTLEVRHTTIVPGAVIGPASADRRAHLEMCPDKFGSVEDLQEAQESSRASLGVIRPRRITGCRVERRTEKERQEWAEKTAAFVDQMRLFEAPTKPIAFIDARFLVEWECNHEKCTGHSMNLHNWGIHELYRKLRDDPDRDAKVVSRMQSNLNVERFDIFLFLGNFLARPRQFGLMGVASFHKASATGDQATLF